MIPSCSPPMSYEESLLAPGEKVLGTFKPHILPYIGWYWLVFGLAGGALASSFLGSGVVGLIIAAVLFLVWLWRIVDWNTNVLMVTNKRVIKGSGILSKKTQDSSLDKITDLALSQGILGRILNYGTLRVLTANESADEVFSSLADPKRAKSVLLSARSSTADRGEARGEGDGDLAAIERLHQRGILSDDMVRELVGKLVSASPEKPQ
jgi:uncharacterized membrane protein YdbT with pleckstrin-like domain